ncbi:IS66 family transposase [Crystallibacter degradans]|uniref:IS66 family transposase n=1 Tax=Crystallibacter degradans TaxID=2726743 RepID=UPI001473CD63|nr:IS66 family transposase [Arthrobacter sp. SF27]
MTFDPPRQVDVPDVPPVSPVPDAPSVEQLLVVLAERDQLIAELTERVKELEARLSKNSQNSSKPPSSDAFVKPPPRSLRRASGRKPGKQSGGQGFRLEPRPEPDEVIVHVPEACGSCGGDLGQASVVGEQTRQVFDLPPIRLAAVEHRAQRRACSCGTVTTASFPSEATAPACYGPGVAALGAYLLGRQHLPVERAAEAMADCFGAPVSTGWLASLLPSAADKLEAFLVAGRAQLAAAEVAHFDETGGRVGAKLRWIHVACTDSLTMYHLASGRGKDSMDIGGVLPDFTGIAVHDGLASYRKYDVTHALCAAHHLRELAGIAEATGQDWPTGLADLLVELHVAVQAAKVQGKSALPARKLTAYRRRYDTLVGQGQQQNPPPPRTGKRGRPALGPAGALLRRLEVYADDVLRFATDFRVPFDNNQAERDVRMVKLQQKISGGWRSRSGADAFLAVRSYLSTARKQNQGALDVLRVLFNGNAWVPAGAGA